MVVPTATVEERCGRCATMISRSMIAERPIHIRDGVGHSDKITAMKRGGGIERMINPCVNDQTRRDGYGKCPQSVRRSRCSIVEVHIPVKLSSELQLLLDRMGKCEIHLSILIRPAGRWSAKKEIGCVEVDVHSQNVLACKKANLVVVLPGT